MISSGILTCSIRSFGANEGSIRFPGVWVGRAIVISEPGLEPPVVSQRMESQRRTSKFGRAWSIRVNSLKDLNVASCITRLETAVKEERKTGNRG